MCSSASSAVLLRQCTLIVPFMTLNENKYKTMWVVDNGIARGFLKSKTQKELNKNLSQGFLKRLC